MTNRPAEKLKSLIKYEIEADNFEFRQWVLKQFDANDENYCSLEEFAVYFLNTLRQYAEVHLKTNGTETPKCLTPVRVSKSNNNGEEAFTPRRLMMDLSLQDISTSNNNLNSKSGNEKNNSSLEFESHSAPRLGTSADRLGLTHNNSTSTPVRRNTSKNSRILSVTPGSANKKVSPGLCLGDFLVFNTPTTSRCHKKKTTPTANQPTTNQKPQTEKPKKRLQPISVSKKKETNGNNSSIFGGESSFSNENNILKISNTELEDKDQCAILAARKSLAMNVCEITEEIKSVSIPQVPAVADTITTSTPVKEITSMGTLLDLKKLEKNLSLKRLADIYALIIDLNLTTNILNEFSLLLNMLNAPCDNNVKNEACHEVDQLHLQDNDSNTKCLSMLLDLSNAIYFALLCLENEKLSLASLDAKSLGVVLISERFSYLNDDVKTYLLEIYQRKQQLAAEKPFYDTSLFFDPKVCNNVYFQHEQDSRENFCSHQEFTNFRAQRDIFYKCLKIWETNHLNPTWRFSTEIAPKIREIFLLSENCINMAHLAKLFVSQLLLSASNASSPEEIGLDVDLLKFSKLAQRLIAPSQFSVDYQFPRAEAFFRDFILKARSLAFAEQLKMELYKQLTTQNDSSLDHINISKAENDTDEHNVSLMDCSLSVIVKPDILNSMLILAKFLGFTMSLPYNISNCNTMPAQVEKDQVRLRLLMQTTFDVYVLLEQAIEQSKLLIVIPWLVQYFAMLDNVTLQIENHMRALKLLFALYTHLGLEKPSSSCTTSLFIIKLCLGWLFESKQFIAEQYYNYRAMLKGKISQEGTIEYDFVKSKLKWKILRCNDFESITLNPYLESLLPIACPFLAEFRVSIMPAKYAQTKNASRTGRYRHITTRLAELPDTTAVKEDGNSPTSTQNNVQNSLIQAFLHSQNSSTRQIIKFCTERLYKSTVKDGQLKILLPAKANADNLVNQITSFEYYIVFNRIKTIYNDAYANVKAEWKEIIPKILHNRINNALESLLPEETSSVLKRTYSMIIEKEAAMKISQWFYVNIITDNYFCPNLKDVAKKICSANENKVQVGTNQLTIIQETPSLSDLIDELQYWLHCTSIRVDRFKNPKPLVNLLKNLPKSFRNELPTFLYHLLGAGIVQLLQHITAKHCAHLSNELIEVACQVWLHPNMINALHGYSSTGMCIYDAFVTKAFIESLGTTTESFKRLSCIIITMIKKQIITVNYVNELFVSILKHEWHPFVLTEISNMLKSIAKETSGGPQKLQCDNACNNENGNESDDDEKSNLFMDMLADLSRDVDFF